MIWMGRAPKRRLFLLYIAKYLRIKFIASYKNWNKCEEDFNTCNFMIKIEVFFNKFKSSCEWEHSEIIESSAANCLIGLLKCRYMARKLANMPKDKECFGITGASSGMHRSHKNLAIAAVLILRRIKWKAQFSACISRRSFSCSAIVYMLRLMRAAHIQRR